MWVGVDQENSKRTLYGLVHCNSIGIHKQKHPSVFASWELISYYTCSCWLTFYRSIYVPVCCHWLVPTPLSGIHSQSDVLAASCIKPWSSIKMYHISYADGWPYPPSQSASDITWMILPQLATYIQVLKYHIYDSQIPKKTISCMNSEILTL